MKYYIKPDLYIRVDSGKLSKFDQQKISAVMTDFNKRALLPYLQKWSRSKNFPVLDSPSCGIIKHGQIKFVDLVTMMEEREE